MRPLPLAGAPPPAPPARTAFLAGGFRPFFLSAPLVAVAALTPWLLSLWGAVPLRAALSPVDWHAHELLYGFAGAAIAGFLLTAVPKWTETAPIAGGGLAAVWGTWLVGRVAMAASGVLAPSVVLALDLLHLPLLLWAVGRPIVARRNRRNYLFLVLLGALFGANAWVHAAGLLGAAALARPGIVAGLDVVLLMVVVVSGRIIPQFTANALRLRGVDGVVRVSPALERWALPVASAALAAELVVPWEALRGALALSAGVYFVVRGLAWAPHQTLRDPLVWILHVGHAWLAVAFLLLAASSLGLQVPVSAARHAMTAGAIGTLALAIMSRATLGHTGRALRAGRGLVVAYVLVTLGAALRVVSAITLGPRYTIHVTVAGVLWGLGLLVFAAVVLPMVLRPRADGLAG